MAAGGARRLFGFVQLEFGFLLGPADGRYLTRPGPLEPPESVIVLRTLGAPRRRLPGRRRRPVRARGPEPAPVPTSRGAVVPAEPLGDRADAEAWLARVRRERDLRERVVGRATRELNRLLRAHRAAAADPYVRDVHPARALAVRVGYGTGQQVADGRFASAYELPREHRRMRRVERLSPQELLAAMLAGRAPSLAADELVLRARADIEGGRPREAALQARIALECVLEELGDQDLGELRGELERDRAAVSAAAAAAVSGDPSEGLRRRVEEAVRRMERALRRFRDRPS